MSSPLTRDLAPALAHLTAGRRRGAALAALGALIALGPMPAAAEFKPPAFYAASGTVSFQFLSFVGPFAQATPANQTNPLGWLAPGLVNGVAPTMTGFAPPAPGTYQDLGYVMGNVDLSATPTNRVSLLLQGNAPGSAAENVIAFTPRNFETTTGVPFVLGTLSFTNGSWHGAGTTPAYDTETLLRFRVTTTAQYAEDTYFNRTFDGTIRMRVGSPSGLDRSTLAGQQAEADWVFMDSPAVIGRRSSTTTNALRVYERGYAPAGASSTGSVQVMAMFNSLDLLGFENAEGGGFLTESVDALSTVPEPGTWALLGTGLLALGGVARRKRVR